MSEYQSEICTKLEQYHLIEVTGADTEKYLQGQLTCDVAKLDIGHQTLTCHCDPKGKISALFRLYRHQTEHFFIIIRQELLPEALMQLRKYAVFSKITFTELDMPIFGTTSGELIAKFSDKLTACQIGGSPTRYLIWGNTSLKANHNGKEWDLIDIQNGIPILHAINQFELIPQAVNLQKIEQAISFTKGCYIGQETIARAKYRGANKRAMFTFQGELGIDDIPEISRPIEVKFGDNWKSTGLILSRVVENNQLWLQVVMNKEIEVENEFRVGNIAIKKVALPYNLDEE
ncbi:hypothetical protein A6B43_05485 [Vespertiliibacter pulmonis]|uniref:tRNA-modifying protein YgfZ-like beta-barrel domain-containing protein n=1 Tax=Vespertiliibacter pulmonis TaxID=1443036 RepID=A0A3N4VV97_9PAST|nr:folate-binding protein [Vespertiliibacter pulmonis]QLB21006.1 hypothetical protein A6B43_05485 [Vespertiliibacter pulmonis]RPE83899.1 hypothetical protein EDC46_1104 [Vespertiliibacter pulmonis]